MKKYGVTSVFSSNRGNRIWGTLSSIVESLSATFIMENGAPSEVSPFFGKEIARRI